MKTITILMERSLRSTTLAQTLELSFTNYKIQLVPQFKSSTLLAKADILIIDVACLPNPITVLTALLSQNSTIAVLFCKQTKHHIPELLQLNLAGYLYEEIEKPELIRAIEVLSSGQRYLHYTVADTLHQIYQKLTSQEPAHPPDNLFTRREWEVLQLLVHGNTNQEISQALFLSESTVKNYLSKLMKKLDVCSRTNVVLTVLRNGWFTL